MHWQEQIKQELANATEGLRNGNDGLARVCARRAVAVATQHWNEQRKLPAWQGDAMHQLRKVQEHTTFPLPIREAAQRKSDRTSACTNDDRSHHRRMHHP